MEILGLSLNIRYVCFQLTIFVASSVYLIRDRKTFPFRVRRFDQFRGLRLSPSASNFITSFLARPRPDNLGIQSSEDCKISQGKAYICNGDSCKSTLTAPYRQVFVGFFGASALVRWGCTIVELILAYSLSVLAPKTTDISFDTALFIQHQICV